MRRYLQGTLDFACGIYAVINALACMFSIDLTEARRLFQDIHIDLASRPELFTRYARNETDHYWLVRYMLSRVTRCPRYGLAMFQPFSNCLLPEGKGTEAIEDLQVDFYLPEAEEADGPASLKGARQEAQAVWQALEIWFCEPEARLEKRAAILRFHRFLPSIPQPVVSHWTTGQALVDKTLLLHDASSEFGALLEIEQSSILPPGNERAFVRIVPESLLLLRPGR